MDNDIFQHTDKVLINSIKHSIEATIFTKNIFWNGAIYTSSSIKNKKGEVGLVLFFDFDFDFEFQVSQHSLHQLIHI